MRAPLSFVSTNHTLHMAPTQSHDRSDDTDRDARAATASASRVSQNIAAVDRPRAAQSGVRDRVGGAAASLSHHRRSGHRAEHRPNSSARPSDSTHSSPRCSSTGGPTPFDSRRRSGRVWTDVLAASAGCSRARRSSCSTRRRAIRARCRIDRRPVGQAFGNVLVNADRRGPGRQ